MVSALTIGFTPSVMKRCALAISSALLFAGLVAPAKAETFRFASQGDLNSLDPYSLNEAFTLTVLGNVYEGLTKRDPELRIVPGLAERWEVIEPTRWRFHLRRGVKFQNGEDFTADDVLFSAERVRAPGSDLKPRLPSDAEVRKVDDYTVDFVLSTPNPILHYEWNSWYIMSKKWAAANGSVMPQPASGQQRSFAALHANGTGPFAITEHQAGSRTLFKPNPYWWDKPRHNFDEVSLSTISNGATRVAALLSGQVDLIDPVPSNDIQRIRDNASTKIVAGAELRVIFLGFDQTRDELRGSSVNGRNPFKDVHVRKAFYQAIDVDAIRSKIMRDQFTPSTLLISSSLFSRASDFKRLPHDPNAARRLLTEAGYGDGLLVPMDCPNDRYVNDEAICQAVGAMLARIGIKVQFNIQPKAKYFAKVLASGGFDTSFYLQGWYPASLESWNVLANIVGCRNTKKNLGQNNLGGYCNSKIDDLAARILVEGDGTKRDEMIAQAFHIEQDDVSHIPIHQQWLTWGVSKKMKIVQPASSAMLFYLFRKE
jgi:peptide/nickel transport system substrate-binding protein